MQYSIIPRILIKGAFPFCRGAVDVFYSLNQQDKSSYEVIKQETIFLDVASSQCKAKFPYLSGYTIPKKIQRRAMIQRREEFQQRETETYSPGSNYVTYVSSDYSSHYRFVS